MSTRRGNSELSERCVKEARLIINESGVEALSMRAVARRLGVSHQAPYKHFPSRDHILAEIVRRAFHNFAQAIDVLPTADPHADMTRMGERYLRFASNHPLEYRLMFGTPLPDPEAHPAMLEAAQHSFALLRDCLMRAYEGHPQAQQFADMDGIFVFATMHG